MEEKNRNFAKFRKTIADLRTPLDINSYNRWHYKTNDSVGRDFTLEEINDIIRTGDLQSLRALSRFYYRTNSIYRNNIDFLAHLFLYDTVVIPLFQEGTGSEKQILKAFYNACTFIDELDVPNTLGRITIEWMITGIYNGIVREKNGRVVLQDLPLEYCRSRFKDFNNLNILEFNLQYFDKITDLELQAEAVATFPEIVQKAWKQWKAGKREEGQWVIIMPTDGGISFSFAHDQTPLLIASIPEIKKLTDAITREATRDQNELYKILIQRMPIDNKGELVFQLDEVADIHASVAEMLKDTDTVEVLTTFGDTDLENLQDSTAASQSSDRIEKYKTNAWNAAGRSSILFNATNSSSLAYSIKKDETIMMAYLNVYESWLKFLINERFKRPGLTFDFEILPTTVFNRSDLQGLYFRGAQYGYSKMFAGVSMGIKQRDQLSLMNFENDFLKMSAKMIPLQSSYTTPGGVITSEENSSSGVKSTKVSQKISDITNTGGRPELPDEEKSEKTQANIEAMG